MKLQLKSLSVLCVALLALTTVVDASPRRERLEARKAKNLETRKNKEVWEIDLSQCAPYHYCGSKCKPNHKRYNVWECIHYCHGSRRTPKCNASTSDIALTGYFPGWHTE